MDDTRLIALLFQRAEQAIDALQEKYGRLCRSIAQHILSDTRDVEECVNDAYLRVWNAIPPERPASLSAYLARITRNIALDRYAYKTADKRNSALTCAFEELEPFLPATSDGADRLAENQAFSEFINRFLREQPAESRIFFVRRYWYGESIHEIAGQCRCGEEKVKTSLFRTRNKLRAAMLKEEIYL